MNNLYLKTVSATTYSNMMELGKSRTEIIRFAKKRLLMVVFLVAILGPIFYIKTGKILLVGITLVLALLIWYTMDREHKIEVKFLRSTKHFEFLNFAKLIVPYLKADSGSKSLYTVLNKMAERTDGKEFKNTLNILIVEIGQNPDSIEPLRTFAKSVSNTDLAEDFMVALYDWQQTSDDTKVISRMETKITEAMVLRIDEIIKIKSDKFDYYVSRIFYSVFFLMMGVLGVVFYAQLAPLLERL